jgi:TetR/AcrR family transcriptional regulator, transcriptional repressor of bet genes
VLFGWLTNLETSMPRPSNTEQRRAQITRALVRVMARRGYDGASIADVAKAARLSSGLVHYHFESKQEILLAALADLTTRHDTELDERLASCRSEPQAELDAFIDYHLGRGANADPEALACWVLLSGEALREPKVRAPFETALQRIAERAARIIRSGVSQGVFRCDSVKAAASALVATIQGYFVLAASARGVIPRGSAARSTRLMMRGLLGGS